MKRIFLILFLILNTIFLMVAQTPAPTIQKHLRAIAKNESSYLSKETMKEYYTDSEVIKKLEKYLGSDKKKVQREAIRLTSNIGVNHQDPDSRSRAIYQLLNTAMSAGSAQADKITKGLQRFKITDFDESNKGQLKGIIEAKRPHLDEFIKLAGFLQMEDFLAPLQENYQANKDIKRNLSVAMARSGNTRKVSSLTRTAEKLPVNDAYVYGVVPLLVYARQKETTDVLFDIIMSDEKTCRPAGPDVPGKILCAYRVIEAVAPYIEDFPVEVGFSGDLITNDYQASLVEVRNWIQVHKSDYKLKTDIY